MWLFSGSLSHNIWRKVLFKLGHSVAEVKSGLTSITRKSHPSISRYLTISHEHRTATLPRLHVLTSICQRRHRESESSMSRGWASAWPLLSPFSEGHPTSLPKLWLCRVQISLTLLTLMPHEPVLFVDRKMTCFKEVPSKKKKIITEICHSWNNYLHFFACLSCTDRACWDWLQSRARKRAYDKIDV